MYSCRSDLYGEERQKRYKFIRDLNLRDNVLQKGDYNMIGSCWDTQYASVVGDLFSKKNKIEDKGTTQPEPNSNVHNSAHIFAQEHLCRYDLTSRDYGKGSRSFRPNKASIDRDIHIVDFSPKYCNAGSTASIYQYSYNSMNNSKSNAGKINQMERRARKADVQSTHFNLGSGKKRISTETSQSYKSVPPLDECSGTFQESNRTRSNIFKQGDWNVVCRNSVNNSVTANDFSKAKVSHTAVESKRLFGKSTRKFVSDMPDYVKTHVRNKEAQQSDKGTSFYQKDFLMGKGKKTTKPSIADAPPSSKVIPREGSPVKSSINKSDFVSYNEELQDLDRSMDLTRNRMRLAENHIKPDEITRKASPGSITTITRNSYLKPRSDALCMMHEKAPLSKYRFLDADDALLNPSSYPLMSGKKAQHALPLVSKGLTTLTDAERNLEDKATHFSLGSDVLKSDTEHTSQFSQPLGLDPKVPAAGVQKISKLEKNFERNNIIPFNDVAMYKELVTVMQKDYKPLESRGFTTPQKRLIDNLEKHPPVLVPSHLFHLDNSKAPLQSRTKTDFIPPSGHVVAR